jgi:hypothetical protein
MIFKSFLLVGSSCVFYALLSFAFGLLGSSTARAEVPATSVSLNAPTPFDRGPAQLEEEVSAEQRKQDYVTVKIMNYTDRPLNYQLARSSGPAWTKTYTLPPRQSHSFSADDILRPSTIRTLNAFGKPGYAFIRFPVADGYEMFKILTNNSYAYVVNENGYGDLVEPTGAKPTARIQPGKERAMLESLEAHHAFVQTTPGAP